MATIADKGKPSVAGGRDSGFTPAENGRKTGSIRLPLTPGTGWERIGDESLTPGDSGFVHG
ncbi:MAG: hypothetical protein KJ670_22690 [Alphaproteobacteria bacterium]|nr:hypothetical protein [Rhizobiaceae bacterium]MBU3963434.1 hypothetical protein [Alphaproteobacteria bacterium]MBU4051898.1 hypothetical protein [Alphaproteobacteria bacterium]MBU4091534.1 hypothetical protein [Alphaproteobacteria bacterium]MBU4157438.1 hypothetical protein [Alphaproteobacteria bacterium]